jgi:hypothetical protein
VSDIGRRPSPAHDVLVEPLAGAETEAEAPPLITPMVAAIWATSAGW